MTSPRPLLPIVVRLEEIADPAILDGAERREVLREAAGLIEALTEALDEMGPCQLIPETPALTRRQWCLTHQHYGCPVSAALARARQAAP